MIEKYFTQLFDIKRLSVTKSAGGVAKSTYSTTTGRKGRIDPLTVAVTYIQGTDRITVTHKLFTTSSEDIKEKDIIIYGAKEFDVYEVLNPFSANHHLEVLLVSRY